MRVIVLLVLVAWLVTSLPQDAFIWTATSHAEGSWHWWMSYGRAFLLGFLPIVTIWVEGILATRHLNETKTEYNERRKRWNRRAGRRDAQWAKDNPLIDEEEFYAAHVTPAKQLAAWVPRMFYLLISIIAISYFAYYEEYGKDLAIYNVEWWGVAFGRVLFEPLVAAIRTFITGVVTYVLGKIAAVLGVQDLPRDFGEGMKKVWAWVFPEKPPAEEVPSLRPTEETLQRRPRSEYSHWRNREARLDEYVRFVKDHDPEGARGVERADMWAAVWNSRGGSDSTRYDDTKELVEVKKVLKYLDGNGKQLLTLNIPDVTAF